MNQVGLVVIRPDGTVALPKAVLRQIHLGSGSKLAIYAEGDSIILKRVIEPGQKQWRELAAKGRKFAKKHQIKREDVLSDD